MAEDKALALTADHTASLRANWLLWTQIHGCQVTAFRLQYTLTWLRALGSANSPSSRITKAVTPWTKRSKKQPGRAVQSSLGKEDCTQAVLTRHNSH